MHPRPRFAALALSAMTLTALLPVPKHEVIAVSAGRPVRAELREERHPPSPVRPSSSTTTSTIAPTTTTAPAPAPTTTTTVQAPQPVQAEPAPVETAGTGACGGDLPPCWVMRRESGGDPRIWNGGCYAPVGWTGTSPCGSSSASGKWQFLRGTFAGYGGYLNAADAPASVQDERARQVWAGGAGCSAWSAC